MTTAVGSTRKTAQVEGTKGRGLRTLKSRVSQVGGTIEIEVLPRLGSQDHLLDPGWYLSNIPPPGARTPAARFGGPQSAVGDLSRRAIGKRSYCAANSGSYNEASLQHKWGDPGTEGR